MTSVQKKTLENETKPPMLNNQMNPTWKIPAWLQLSEGADCPLLFSMEVPQA